MEFEWDDAKHAKRCVDRGGGFDDGARIFEGPVVIWQDTRRDYGEDRFRPSEKAKVMFCMWCLLGAAQQCE